MVPTERAARASLRTNRSRPAQLHKQESVSTAMTTEELIQIVWDYQLMHQELRKADAIVVLGSHDIQVGEYAAKLYLDGWAPLLVFSGGVGRLTEDWQKPEAEVFAEAAMRLGVPKDKILLEDQSTNTGENIQLTKTLLSEKDVDVKTIILVQKPYMERRAYATCRKQWPEVDVVVTSPPILCKDYAPVDRTHDEWISVLVGDLQRIKLYAEKGFMIPQDIPANVWAAYEELVACGYDAHMLKE